MVRYNLKKNCCHTTCPIQWHILNDITILQVFLYCKHAFLYCKLIASNVELNFNNMWTRELQLEWTIFSSKTTCTMIMHLEQVILSSTIASATKMLVVIMHAPCDKIVLQLWWISKVVIATSLKVKIKIRDLVVSYKIENTNIMINKKIN
jgi:hypothetical protein